MKRDVEKQTFQTRCRTTSPTLTTSDRYPDIWDARASLDRYNRMSDSLEGKLSQMGSNLVADALVAAVNGQLRQQSAAPQEQAHDYSNGYHSFGKGFGKGGKGYGKGSWGKGWGGGRGGVICFRCSQPGHIAWECPNLPAGPVANPAAPSAPAPNESDKNLDKLYDKLTTIADILGKQAEGKAEQQTAGPALLIDQKAVAAEVTSQVVSGLGVALKPILEHNAAIMTHMKSVIESKGGTLPRKRLSLGNGPAHQGVVELTEIIP